MFEWRQVSTIDTLYDVVTVPPAPSQNIILALCLKQRSQVKSMQ